MNYEIVQDMDPISPRDFDTFGKILYTSSRYILGDERVSAEEINAILEDKNNICLPVYAYIHSGVTVNTAGFSCPWDSGQSGIIFVSKDKVRESFNVKRITKKIEEKVLLALKAEVSEYDRYINGDMYGYIVRDDAGSIIDSCYGFFSMEDAKEAAEDAISYARSA